MPLVSLEHVSKTFRRGRGPTLHAVNDVSLTIEPGETLGLIGESGAGKSTLVAAAYRAGLDVLGDETVLVARDDPDDLLAAVRRL